MTITDTIYDDKPTIKVCLISSFDDKCGISNYSSLLMEGIKNKISSTNVLIDRRTLPTSDKFELRSFSNLAKKLKGYDIAHIQYEKNLFGKYGVGVLPFYSNIPKEVKVVTTIHEITPKPVSMVGNLSDYVLLKHICKNSNLVIVHNVYSKNYLLKNKFVKESKIQVVQHGLKIESLEKEEARVRIGLPLNRKIIVIPGNISKNKQYEKILTSVHKEFLVIAAGNDTGNKNEDYLDYLREYQNFRWVDRLNDEKLRYYIAAADIVALYYSSGTVSSTLFIAMGLYKKIITSNISIFKEIQETYPSLKISKDKFIGEDISFLYNEEIERVNLTGMTWEMTGEKHIEEYKKLVNIKPNPNFEVKPVQSLVVSSKKELIDLSKIKSFFKK
jgi:glycosyltransferase involved in cell wall biosynthesis